MHVSQYHQIVSKLVDSDLSYGDQICFQVTSNSMHPIINKGDSVIAEVISGRDVQCGDIVVVKRKDDFLAHRAILHNKNGWLIKGDNNTIPDHLVPITDIIGRVTKVKKNNHEVNLESRKWKAINPYLAKLGWLQIQIFLHHPVLRLPLRFFIKIIQITTTLHHQ